MIDTAELVRRVGRRVREPWMRHQQQGRTREALRLVPAAVEAAWQGRRIPAYVSGPPRATGSAVIVPLDDPQGETRWVAKFATSESDWGALQRATRALSTLRGIPELSSWAGLIPDVIGSGTVADHGFVIETALPGRAPTAADWQSAGRDAPGSLIEAISGLHALTARSLLVDDAVLTRWVDERLHELMRHSDGSDRITSLDRVRSALHTALEGHTLSAGWIHGDYWLGNVLLDDDGRVSGIVDWESASAGELALHDLVHMVLYSRRAIEHVHLGRVVRTALEAALPARDDDVLTRAGEEAGGLDRRTAIALYWLRFVSANLRRHPELGGNRTWQRENVDLVLASF